MNDNKKSKKQRVAAQNVLETLKSVGSQIPNETKQPLGEMGADVVQTLREEIGKMPQGFVDQLLGTHPQKISGEIVAGETVEFREVKTPQDAAREKLKMQISYERRLRYEEKVESEKKRGQLQIQLKAIMQESLVITQKFQGLSKEARIATMQAPVEPGIYHVVFFEKLVEYMKNFSKKIEQASTWLHTVNQRAAKKNRWGQLYKKHGAKYLLSGEHYVSRSAG